LTGTSRITFEDVKLAARQVRAHHDFHRALVGCSPGARLLQPTGVEALVVPACPWFSVLNCVFSYESALALEEAVPELDREFARAGVGNYRVWVPAEDTQAGIALAERGFACRTAMVRMASLLPVQDLEPRRVLELLPDPSWQTIARCNDRAYGLPAELTIAGAFSTLDDPAFHRYAVPAGGDVVSVAVTHETAGNCYICFMATVPEAQGTGIGVELVRTMKRSARERGCEVACGESTYAGERLYLRGGARGFGLLGLWERGPLPGRSG